MRTVAQVEHPDGASLATALEKEARLIHQEDLEASREMGRAGAELINDGDACLTHCNAGALATGGLGTALAVFYAAREAGKTIHVYADETRPLLQGARLTAFELLQNGIPCTLICDDMAGFLMKQQRIQGVFTGADRVACNGDAANKIGTYSLAVLANHHRIPFYVVAPVSTFDADARDGSDIPIEERRPDEVRGFRSEVTAPENVEVWNPAFDVTPAELITAIITEKGVHSPPYTDAITSILTGEDAGA
jgi:methylthioribose-1-phosphate isomerase